jgi:hypothetical protein
MKCYILVTTYHSKQRRACVSNIIIRIPNTINSMKGLTFNSMKGLTFNSMRGLTFNSMRGLTFNSMRGLTFYSHVENTYMIVSFH